MMIERFGLALLLLVWALYLYFRNANRSRKIGYLAFGSSIAMFAWGMSLSTGSSLWFSVFGTATTATFLLGMVMATMVVINNPSKENKRRLIISYTCLAMVGIGVLIGVLTR